MCSVFDSSAWSWQRMTGHVPRSRGLFKEGLERKLKLLDSKNSALAASSHCSHALVWPVVGMDFLQPL